MSHSAIDAVITSHRPAVGPVAAPPSVAPSRGEWEWLANFPDQDKPTGPKAAALATVLAEFGL
ncbi:MAG: hypothetical protein ACLP9L_27445 [Thermoguttaceae bacterium]